jgi:hypothetical protein
MLQNSPGSHEEGGQSHYQGKELAAPSKIQATLKDLVFHGPAVVAFLLRHANNALGKRGINLGVFLQRPWRRQRPSQAVSMWITCDFAGTLPCVSAALGGAARPAFCFLLKLFSYSPPGIG